MKKFFQMFGAAMLMALVFHGISSGQSYINSVSGSWLGKIELGAAALRVVFNITTAGTNTWDVTLDSPDQGAKGIKIGPIVFNSNEISIKAPALLAEYTGVFKSDTLIEGTFTQAGKSIPLNLHKLKEDFVIKRPQEPKPPFPYTAEEVTFLNSEAGIELAGTLTIPEGKGPHPAVILLTGSGTQDRDETIMGHKPFLVIADNLSRNGIAVLRYDDRGAGRSKGTPADASSADFASDARAALEYLYSRTEINASLTGLAGHSEGGLIAAIVAAGNPGVAFVISLAGPGVQGEKLLHTQNMDISKASGVGIKDIKKGIAYNKKLFKILRTETDNDEAEKKITEKYKEMLSKDKTPAGEMEKAINQLNAQLNKNSYNWMRNFILTDPASYWKRVNCPVLALNGEKDLQVNAGINLPAIEKALRSGGNNQITVKALPELNHLFQHCTTGLPGEYGEIEETFSPEVLKIMSEWVNGLPKSRQAFSE